MANIDRFLNYENYDDEDPLYYGFHEKNGRISIDTKRLKKLGYGNVFDTIVSLGAYWFLLRRNHISILDVEVPNDGVQE